MKKFGRKIKKKDLSKKDGNSLEVILTKAPEENTTKDKA